MDGVSLLNTDTDFLKVYCLISFILQPTGVEENIPLLG